jgi:hypothetical protein
MAFSAEWLRLREPVDHAARSETLTEAIAARVGGRTTVAVLDIATGTGSNVRYLLPRLPCTQTWQLIDHDPQLLGALPTEMRAWGAGRGHTVDARATGPGLTLRGPACTHRLMALERDLSTLDSVLGSTLDSVLGTAIDATALAPRVDLVTASAILDLVSEAWIGQLAALCRRTGAAVLLALTYDGRIACTPDDPDDEAVCALVNAHQRGDKGFGPAAGPSGVRIAERCFIAEGYDVRLAPSDWRLGPMEGALQRELLEGWAEAAMEMAPADTTTVHAWRTRRLEHLKAGRSHLHVGHQDMAAWMRSEAPRRGASVL